MLTEISAYDMYINSIADRLKTDIVFQGNINNPILECDYLLSQIYDSYKKVNESEEYYAKLQNIYGKDDIIKAFWVKYKQKVIKVINDLVNKHQITEILT